MGSILLPYLYYNINVSYHCIIILAIHYTCNPLIAINSFYFLCDACTLAIRYRNLH